MEFPEKLERVIARSGKSQSAIARETGIGQSAISAMTRGERRPFMDQALKLARATGVSLDFLASDELDEAPPASEFTEEERAVVKLFRALQLDEEEALRRLATPAAAGDAWLPGAVRTLPTSPPQRHPRREAPPLPDAVQGRLGIDPEAEGRPKRKGG